MHNAFRTVIAANAVIDFFTCKTGNIHRQGCAFISCIIRRINIRCISNRIYDHVERAASRTGLTCCWINFTHRELKVQRIYVAICGWCKDRTTIKRCASRQCNCPCSGNRIKRPCTDRGTQRIECTVRHTPTCWNVRNNNCQNTINGFRINL